ncbi:MAG: hypothetical protein WBP08_00510 [Saprospiraceae bacterium]
MSWYKSKSTGQGTGLDPSLVYDIMKAHGGELKVETPSDRRSGKEGKGGAFIISLPII